MIYHSRIYSCDRIYLAQLHILYIIDISMVFTEMVVDNGLGKVIGESPAEACNSCGEITQFYFEDIGMWLSVSTDYSKRIDPSKGDYIEPEYPCAGEDAIKTLYDIVSDN